MSITSGQSPVCQMTVSQPSDNTDQGLFPGVRCPTCAAKGVETWVIEGRACGTCGTPCL
ncbi:hypothetical protein QBC41DRAFT_230773 [Cercophora samala]|uniref:Uncharacterized protein n=1 Tax=Cercophora samala TaxID=330535 RepID=A0AA40D7M8_9PEZI|nr:hypothetical protein QBC41DRAFT_230773 [Cercophora samala]